jgi:hypothetical protein
MIHNISFRENLDRIQKVNRTLSLIPIKWNKNNTWIPYEYKVRKQVLFVLRWVGMHRGLCTVWQCLWTLICNFWMKKWRSKVCIGWNVRSKVRLLEDALWLHLFGCCFISIILDSFNITYPYFTPHIILQSNVRISLVYPKKGNIRVQVEQRLQRNFKRIDFSKLMYRLRIHTI